MRAAMIHVMADAAVSVLVIAAPVAFVIGLLLWGCDQPQSENNLDPQVLDKLVSYLDDHGQS